MRVISGILGGRSFESPKGHRTHPMGDKIRGALFNVLGDISGLTVLDTFAGSGAISIEALSRGASQATMLETDKEAYQTIQDNIRSLDIAEHASVMHINARSWSYRNNTERFDLVICDPPYDRLQEAVIEKLAKHTREGGVLVLSLPPHADIRIPETKFEFLAKKSYGDATLAFYRRIA